jgi:predicted amidohydrolase YtcJ
MGQGDLTLLAGGVVYTGRQTDPPYTAMLVAADRIAWIGTDAGASQHRDTATTVVDLEGALVTPGFVDAHIHATDTGLALSGLDLAGCRSLADVLAALERRCRQVRGHVILGHGWDETHWPEHRPPTASELDRASYGSIVYLSRVDVHSAVVSSALLASVPEVAGLDGYDASGVQRRAAHHLVRRAALDTITTSQRRAAHRLTRSTAAALGIVSLHEMAGPQISSESDLEALLTLAAEQPGPDIVGYWGQTAADGGLEVVRRLGLPGAAGDLFVDGAIGSRTACLHQPYRDAAGESGTLYLSADQIADHVSACSREGLQAGFHVIGDAAMTAVISGFQQAAAAVGAATVRAARHRIEHAEMVQPEQALVLAALGVFASVQPAFDAAWGLANGTGMYESRLGIERAATLNPFADLARAGIWLAFGSDAPVTALDPWGTVRAAAYHRTPEQRLTIEAAFAAHTSGGWRATGIDDGGELTVGSLASYAIWQPSQASQLAPAMGTTTALEAITPAARAVAIAVDPATPDPTCKRTVASGITIHDDNTLGRF